MSGWQGCGRSNRVGKFDPRRLAQLITYPRIVLVRERCKRGTEMDTDFDVGRTKKPGELSKTSPARSASKGGIFHLLALRAGGL